MKIWLIRRVPGWYWGFIAGVFLLLVLLPDVMQLVAADQNGPRPFYHGKTDQPQVAFACNVFWGEEFLPEMLAELDRKNIKITFFIGGSWAKRNPQMLQMIAEHGHELGNHSYSHPHPNALSRQQNQDQIMRTEALVAELTGRKTRLYAPPYGEFNSAVLAAAADLDYTTILWSIDTIDWKRPPEEVLIARVTKKLHNGAIILMHPTAPTARALPELIARVQAAGYTIGPVSDILP
ncbi:MAG: polysaccharide deacetylase family protein [Negativicutes bacterium]|nr:polysaccharide deacetylase family protein [Negativicutes bacterium]